LSPKMKGRVEVIGKEREKSGRNCGQGDVKVKVLPGRKWKEWARLR